MNTWAFAFISILIFLSYGCSTTVETPEQTDLIEHKEDIGNYELDEGILTGYSVLEPENHKDPEEFAFPSTSIVGTQDGVSISIDKFDIENKSTWGKVVNLSVTILNQGKTALSPSLVIYVFLEGEDITENTRKFDMDIIGLDDHANYIFKDAISFSGTGEKIFRIALYEGYHTKTFLVSVETKIQI